MRPTPVLRSACLLCCATFARIAIAVPVQWPVNGHYYEVVGPGTNWPDACEAARQLTHLGLNGHLVSFSTQAEYDFVVDNVIPAEREPFWAGAYQEPGGVECTAGWHWIAAVENPMALACTREVYNAGCSGAQEDVAEFSCENARWNDSAWCQCRRYVVEYEQGNYACPAIDQSSDCLSTCSQTCDPPGPACSAPDPSSCSNPGPACSGGGCGNGECIGGEDCANCSLDCGPCNPGVPATSEWGIAAFVLLILTSGTVLARTRPIGATAPIGGKGIFR